jgi:hypothetical protein
MANETAVVEIGDYAVSCGLRFAVFFDTLSPPRQASWVGLAEERWGDMFAGVYYGDEPGGKMLDGSVNLAVNVISISIGGIVGSAVSPQITKMAGGGISVYENNSNINYYPNGRIAISKWTNPSVISDDIPELNGNITTYYPNGTITLLYENGDLFTMENGSSRISQLEPYEKVLSRNPIPNYTVAAEKFINRNQQILEGLNKQWSLNQSFPLFTSDYALYWWDYLSGYDVMLAQLGWNNTVAQEIGLVRGAANLQGKSWGTILTWKYTEAPYLASGDELYNQMRTSYECGAKYVVLFNYAENMTEPYGILQDEHFDALKRFWNDVVQNPLVLHGGTHAVAALVLPSNYGWGMRHPDDNIWGIWCPNETSAQIWTQLQHNLKAYGSRLDIVYDDPGYPVAGKYGQIVYWNQTR